jgi:diaminopimelate epimerase
MRFSKLQAAGNDFILADSLAEARQRDWGKLACAMCDRHFGVGADGLILAENSTVADLRMRVFNADGSEAEVSGNGLRCFVKYAIEQGLISQTRSRSSQVESRSPRFARSVTVETLSGVRKVKAYISGGRVRQVEVSMGQPQFQPERIPVKVQSQMSVASVPMLDYPVKIGSKRLRLSLISMGNPHAVTFSSQPVANFPLAEIGPKVENHPIFPKKTNFEVARVLSRRKIEARVWERGVGETLACGSGACAIAVAAQLLEYASRQVDIIFPGGTLTVSWDKVGDVLLNGPVEQVFAGEWLGEVS